MSDNNIAARGDFRGDFSRDTFDPMKHFSRVLMQQGRVQLDADWNEQVSILLHYMRQLGRDLMGPHGAPKDYDGQEGTSFQITAKEADFFIGIGRYYVNGILCENQAAELTYLTQQPKPDEAFIKDDKLKQGEYLVYLDVWERHLTYVEDDYMREKALGGADTATRAQIVWQVKVKSKPPEDDRNASEKWDKFIKEEKYNDFLQVLKKEKQPGTGLLKAQAKKTEVNKEPCLTSPEAMYRGTENQLYRVEIHKSNVSGDPVTFKWSRENGSVIFPITDIAGKIINLEHLGRDDRFSLQHGDWVEVIDDDVILLNKANKMLKIDKIDMELSQVTLNADSPISFNSNKHPYLRKWDQKNGNSDGLPIQWKKQQGPQSTFMPESDMMLLEDGIEIQFIRLAEGQEEYIYQTGDYWLVPARTATGDVEWPGPVGNPEDLPPHGVQHHYAPLAIITVNADGRVEKQSTNLRRHLKQSWE